MALSGVTILDEVECLKCLSARFVIDIDGKPVSIIETTDPVSNAFRLDS